MKRVVERCPSCGVEHDHVADGCEACGSALRYWCRTHSREIGWLDADVCPRCPPVAGRAAQPRAASAPPTPTIPAPSPAKWRRTMAAPPPAVPVAAPPPAVPVAEPTPVVVSPAPAPSVEPAAEAENRVAKEPAAQGPFVRLVNAVLTLLQGAIAGGLLGMGAGAIYGFYVGADIPRTALEWGVYGGVLASLYGLVGAGILLMARSRSKRGP